MSESDNQPGFWARLGRALRWSLLTLLKMVFILAIIALAGLVPRERIPDALRAIDALEHYRAGSKRVVDLRRRLEHMVSENDAELFDDLLALLEIEPSETVHVHDEPGAVLDAVI